MKPAPVIVSACLAGFPCRYDGGFRLQRAAIELIETGRGLPVCPEQLGGLPTPREPAEIRGGDGAAVLSGQAHVLTAAGADLTTAFRRGAEAVLGIARLYGARSALLAERSPSCGVKRIHDGLFQGRLVPGTGVTAALLRSAGLFVQGAEGDV